MGRLYRVLVKICRAITPRMKTIWAEPFVDEPCVFVCNHAGAFGPIDMCTKFPYRENCYSWLNADMMDPKAVPAYVRQDYWWKPGCFGEPLLNATLPYLAAAILPPILRSAPGVPVYHDARVMTTMRTSLKLLKEGKYLIIFPEQPSGFQSHHDWINTGWLQIAVMYFRATGKALRFWPVHIDYHRHQFTVSKSILFDTTRSLADQTDELVQVLAAGLRGQAVESSASTVSL